MSHEEDIKKLRAYLESKSRNSTDTSQILLEAKLSALRTESHSKTRALAAVVVKSPEIKSSAQNNNLTAALKPRDLQSPTLFRLELEEEDDFPTSSSYVSLSSPVWSENNSRSTSRSNSVFSSPRHSRKNSRSSFAEDRFSVLQSEHYTLSLQPAVNPGRSRGNSIIDRLYSSSPRPLVPPNTPHVQSKALVHALSILKANKLNGPVTTTHSNSSYSNPPNTPLATQHLPPFSPINSANNSSRSSPAPLTFAPPNTPNRLGLHTRSHSGNGRFSRQAPTGAGAAAAAQLEFAVHLARASYLSVPPNTPSNALGDARKVPTVSVKRRNSTSSKRCEIPAVRSHHRVTRSTTQLLAQDDHLLAPDDVLLQQGIIEEKVFAPVNMTDEPDDAMFTLPAPLDVSRSSHTQDLKDIVFLSDNNGNDAGSEEAESKLHPLAPLPAASVQPGILTGLSSLTFLSSTVTAQAGVGEDEGQVDYEADLLMQEQQDGLVYFPHGVPNHLN